MIFPQYCLDGEEFLVSTTFSFIFEIRKKNVPRLTDINGNFPKMLSPCIVADIYQDSSVFDCL